MLAGWGRATSKRKKWAGSGEWYRVGDDNARTLIALLSRALNDRIQLETLRDCQHVFVIKRRCVDLAVHFSVDGEITSELLGSFWTSIMDKLKRTKAA